MEHDTATFPMRINKYLAWKKHCTRKDADILIGKGLILINGAKAVLGQKVQETDKVEVRFRTKKFRYYAYNKPRGVITHSPQLGEQDIAHAVPIEGVFPIGRLDKDSHGLIILTDDGRVTEALLSPTENHEKEYRVTVREDLRPSFAEHMSKGVDISDYVTKPCKVHVLSETKFSVILSEGKKHQIRRMCSALHVEVEDLQRVRIMNIKLGNMAKGTHRAIEGDELTKFLRALGL